jgi:hypothetical protein
MDKGVLSDASEFLLEITLIQLRLTAQKSNGTTPKSNGATPRSNETTPRRNVTTPRRHYVFYAFYPTNVNKCDPHQNVHSGIYP